MLKVNHFKIRILAFLTRVQKDRSESNKSIVQFYDIMKCLQLPFVLHKMNQKTGPHVDVELCKFPFVYVYIHFKY